MNTIFSRWFKRNFSNPQAVILATLLVAGFLVIYLMGNILMPLLVACVLAYLLEWAVGALEKKGLNRLLAVIVVFVSFCTISLLIMIGVVPLVGHQIELLFTDLPNMASNIRTKLMELPQEYPDIVSTEQLERVIQQLGGSLSNVGDILVSVSLASFKNIVTILIYMILVPLLVFFFLKDKQTLLRWFARWVPSERQLSMRVWNEVDVQIGNYVRGKVVEIFLVGVTAYVLFVVLSLNYAVLLAVLVGLSVLVPYIGATLVTIPVALVGLIQFGTGDTLLYLMIFYFIIQALDGNVLVPLLFSETNNLHPVAIIAAVLFFGGIWGFWGVFFAIPLATLVVAVIEALDDSQQKDTVDNTATA